MATSETERILGTFCVPCMRFGQSTQRVATFATLVAARSAYDGALQNERLQTRIAGALSCRWS